MIIYDDVQLIIKHYQEIVLLEDYLIIIKYHNMTLKIKGKQLSIDYIDHEELRVNGKIEGISCV